MVFDCGPGPGSCMDMPGMAEEGAAGGAAVATVAAGAGAALTALPAAGAAATVVGAPAAGVEAATCAALNSATSFSSRSTRSSSALICTLGSTAAGGVAPCPRAKPAVSKSAVIKNNPLRIVLPLAPKSSVLGTVLLDQKKRYAASREPGCFKFSGLVRTLHRRRIASILCTEDKMSKISLLLACCRKVLPFQSRASHLAPVRRPHRDRDDFVDGP